jgi:hypothetical protein
MKLGIGKKNPWKILYRDCSFRFDTFTNIAATGNSCFRLVNFCITFPRSRMKGERHRLSQRTSHRCILPSFVTFGQAVSEKIFKNRPIRKKNCLWWPCLLTDRNEMINRNRGLSINASYKVPVHLAKRFQRRIFKISQIRNKNRLCRHRLSPLSL